MGLYKRDKIWWLSITHQGKQIRRTTGTSSKKLAQAIYSKLTVKIFEKKFFDIPQERTFQELMKQYMEEHGNKLASKIHYKGYIKNLLPFFGRKNISEITPKDIVDYKSKRYQDQVKPATINRELAVMKNAYNLAIKEWDWCKDNPVSKVSMEKENNNRDRWITKEEESRLLLSSAPWVKELILFALNTGMRQGEILNLTHQAVDLIRKTVTVLKSKNGERRTIPINQTIIELLNNKVRSITDLVFHTRVHTKIGKDNLRRAFNLAKKRANIKDLKFHDLRHTFASRLVQQGIDIYKVQMLLGHKTGAMTQRYSHHSSESLRDGVNILDKTKKTITILSQ